MHWNKTCMTAPLNFNLLGQFSQKEIVRMMISFKSLFTFTGRSRKVILAHWQIRCPIYLETLIYHWDSYTWKHMSRTHKNGMKQPNEVPCTIKVNGKKVVWNMIFKFQYDIARDSRKLALYVCGLFFLPSVITLSVIWQNFIQLLNLNK